MNTRNLIRVTKQQTRVNSTSANQDWLASIKHTFLSAFDQSNPNQQKLNLPKYNQLRLQSIQFPYLKRSLVDHQSISKLIQELNLSQPTQSINLFNDLKSIWGFDPTDQDHLAYLSALVAQAHPLPSDVPDHLRFHLLERANSYHQAIKITRPPHHRSELELAYLIRFSIKDNLEPQLTDQLIAQLPIAKYQNQTLIHGALLFRNSSSLQFVLNQLNQNSRLEPWIEVDLIQKISQDGLQEFELLTDVLSKILKHYPHHQHLNRALVLVETIMTHIKLSSYHPVQINSLGDHIYRTTGIEIFRDQSERLAGQLFDRIPSITHRPFELEELVEWYELSKTRGAKVFINPLISMLDFKLEISKRPDLVDQLIGDFQSTTRLQSISSSDFFKCFIGFLRLSIYLNRPDLAESTLELSEPEKNNTNQPTFTQDMTIELMEGLLQISEGRDQAFKFYEHLTRLGQPNFKFFQIFLREYLKLIETPKTNMERPQALSVQKLMKILEDMKTNGIRANNQIYSNLLNHYSSIVKKNPRNNSTRIQLERIHTLIKLDVNLEPDFHLLHQLFKAFSYNGLYEKAWSIWEKFFSSPVGIIGRRKESDYRKISNASFATMFDLAGYESERVGDGRLNLKAIEAWNFLLQQYLDQRTATTTQDPNKSFDPPSNSCLNKNVFDSWVECLCRCRRMGEVVSMIFERRNIVVESNKLEMIPKQVLDELVTTRTLSILVRFSSREDHVNLACLDFSVHPKSAAPSWSSKIRQLILVHFPKLKLSDEIK